MSEELSKPYIPNSIYQFCLSLVFPANKEWPYFCCAVRFNGYKLDLHVHFLVLLLLFLLYCLNRCIACENIHFFMLFATGDVSRRIASATQRQKFHTDDANQCLHNKSGSHGVPNINLSNFTYFLVDFGKVLCSSANELQQISNASSREDYIPQTLTVLLEILRIYIWPLWPFVFCLSFVNNS